MAKFCTECGKEIAEGTAVCAECGTKAPATEDVTEVTSTAVHTSKAQNSYQEQETYTQTVPDPASKVVGTGAYFGLMLLFAIPIIGFIACIIMAFAPKNKNIKHFARATLIWMVIALVLAGVLIAVITLMTNVITNYVNQLTDGQFSGFGDLFGQLGDLEGLMEQYGSGDLEGLMEQYQNSGLDSLPIE